MIRRAMISGGGTGGHIYPAIAIADEIKRRNPDAELRFVGAQDRMEMRLVPRAGYEIDGLWISGIQRKWSLKNLSIPFKVMGSLYKAWRLIRRHRPEVVVGTGGYASWPLLRVATWMGIPAVIQEQNAYAGLSNRLLAKSAAVVCVAYPDMERYFDSTKLVRTGNPVRAHLIDCDHHRSKAMHFFDQGQQQKTIAVTGGSLGARSLNRAMHGAADALRERPDVSVIWQTGRTDYEAMSASQTAALDQVEIREFVHRMDYLYAAADVVISRAGALSIAEIATNVKAAIFVPSPNVAEDHQTKNARQLADAGAALCCADIDAEEKLIAMALALLEDDEKRHALQSGIKAFASADADKLIVNEIEKLITKSEEQK